jgi:histone-lysine N-methyltransferase SUV39H
VSVYPVEEEVSSLFGSQVAQRGRQHAIDIRKTENRGWGKFFDVNSMPDTHLVLGVFAAEFIPKGTFLGIYSGELLLDVEAEVRAEK